MQMFSPFGKSPWGADREMPNPFAAFGVGAARPSQPNGASEPPAAAPPREDEIRDLKDQLAAMRQQIADLAQRK